jgi:hypothetical protein
MAAMLCEDNAEMRSPKIPAAAVAASANPGLGRRNRLLLCLRRGGRASWHHLWTFGSSKYEVEIGWSLVVDAALAQLEGKGGL